MHDGHRDVPTSSAVARRNVLRAGLVGAGVTALSGLAATASSSSAYAATTTVDPATLHLLRRTTFGLTDALLAEVTAVGSAAWLEQQLAPATIDDSACDAIVARFPLAAADPPTVVAKVTQFGGWDAMLDLTRATIARSIWSKRQLFEVMVEFWSNHFNVTNPNPDVWSGRAWEDSAVIRANALGRFEDMLLASSRSPSMGVYLNNFDSSGTNPNENYARELLELHTVGVDSGYTHDDIAQAALALTGHGYWNPWNGGTATTMGTWRFDPARHYVGAVKVMGWSHLNSSAAGGPEVTDSLVKYLAHHPATAAHLATKLCLRFVSDTPPASLVSTLAAVYLANDTQIAPVLRALFASAEFKAATGRKLRRPYEDLVATLRACGLAVNPSAKTVGGIDAIGWFAGTMGQMPLSWDTPDGFPDIADKWIGSGTTLFRWNMHVGVTQHWPLDGLTYPDLYKTLVPATGITKRSQLIDALIAKLLPGIAVSSAHRNALITFMGGDATLNANTGDTTWLFPIVVALVLDSPYWTVR